jgi:hypothetical protein
LGALVEVADKEAKLIAFELSKAKAQGLLYLLITENADLMVLRGIQTRDLEAVFVWPQEGLLLVYFHRKVSRMAHEYVVS